MKNLQKKAAVAALAFGLLGWGAFHQSTTVKASDHDDGESTAKARNLNLTDLYAFREDWQTGVATDAANMIFIMNTNPRSVARQQYFFNSTAKYRFHVSNRVAAGGATAANATVTGVEDSRFEFSFSEPNAQTGTQQISLDIVRFANGQPVSAETKANFGSTTAAVPTLGNTGGNNAPTPVANPVAVNGGNLTVFAGLREDPFFFDVDAFFRVRAGLVGSTPSPDPGGVRPQAGFGDNTTAVDFAKGYNVNAIVLRVPIAVLQNGNAAATTFDVWETIAVPQTLAALPKEAK